MFSREAAPGSREENAQNQKAGAPIRFFRIGKGSSPFERLLEALDEEDPPFPERGVSSGAARFYARAFVTPARDGYYSGDAVESLYVEALAPGKFFRARKTQKSDLTADFADIRHQLARTHSLADCASCAAAAPSSSIPTVSRRWTVRWRKISWRKSTPPSTVLSRANQLSPKRRKAVVVNAKRFDFMRQLILLTGSGISANSGLDTFRTSGEKSLWAQYDADVVCNFDCWEENFDLVHQFYSARRKQLGTVAPNAAHRLAVSWQERFGADLITQNVDDLFERAGARDVLHVHGSLTSMRCLDCETTWDVGYQAFDPATGCCPQCGALWEVKPNVVFFNERAPLYHRNVATSRRTDR